MNFITVSVSSVFDYSKKSSGFSNKTRERGACVYIWVKHILTQGCIHVVQMHFSNLKAKNGSNLY
jgi:hypothetical protein